MAGQMGRVKEFNPQEENITAYLERLQLYFEYNGVEDAKRVPALLTLVGAKVYGTLRSLVAPNLPKDKDYGSLADVLKQHFDPKPLVITEWFRFYKRVQSSTESIAEFVADLRRLSIHSEFGIFLNEALRDRFVCGVEDQHIQKKLLAEDGLTMAQALGIAQGMEAAAKNSKRLHQDVSPTAGGDIARVAGSGYKNPPKKKSCYCCGRYHEEKDCKFREVTGHSCGKQGHIAPVCKSRSRQTPPPKPNNRKKYTKSGSHKKALGDNKWVGAGSGVDSADSTDSQAMFAVHDPHSQPILIPVDLNGKSLQMELDTGATVSIMSQQKFASLFPSTQIPRSKVTLQTYTGEPMKVLGEVPVQVTYQQQPTQDLQLVVVEGNGPSLLGRNWLHHIKLDWTGIKAVLSSQRSLAGLLETYKEIFADELGTIQPYKAKLIVAPSAVPKYHRPRSVPFTS